MTETFTHCIDGRAVPGTSHFEVLNPATEAPFALCPDATREQLDQAVAAARRAQPGWDALGWKARRTALHELADALRGRVAELAPLLTAEQGKPLAMAEREVMNAAHSLEGLSVLELEDEVAKSDAAGSYTVTYRPLGVVGAITPWNVPLGLACHKIAQALYAGDTVVVKPSPYTPLTTLAFGALAADVLPAGVLNVLGGGNDLGRWMTEHPGIDMISFTGSVETGKRVMAAAALGGLKRVTLELGGNDAAIVLPDADLDAVAPGIFNAAFANSGQICMAIKRVYVPEAMHDGLCTRLARLASAARVGDGAEAGVELGPLQNRMQFDKVLDLIADAKRAGAQILTGGEALQRPGYFIAPTVLCGVQEGVRIVDEEQFGPVLPVMSYATVDEAIERANGTRMGLGASLWTSDPEAALPMAARLEAGTVWINKHIGVDYAVPFGGVKESGFGREFAQVGLQSYMEARVVYSPSPRSS